MSRAGCAHLPSSAPLIVPVLAISSRPIDNSIRLGWPVVGRQLGARQVLPAMSSALQYTELYRYCQLGEALRDALDELVQVCVCERERERERERRESATR